MEGQQRGKFLLSGIQDGYNRIGDIWNEPFRMGFLGKKAKAKRCESKRHKKHEQTETRVQCVVTGPQGACREGVVWKVDQNRLWMILNALPKYLCFTWDVVASYLRFFGWSIICFTKIILAAMQRVIYSSVSKTFLIIRITCKW